MKAYILSTLVLAGITNLAVAGDTPVQQSASVKQAAPVVQQSAPVKQAAPVAQQSAPTQQTTPAQQTAPAVKQTAPVQQAAPAQAVPQTARERRAQRRAQVRSSGQWTRVARPAVQ